MSPGLNWDGLMREMAAIRRRANVYRLRDARQPARRVLNEELLPPADPTDMSERVGPPNLTSIVDQKVGPS